MRDRAPTATSALSLHDALPIFTGGDDAGAEGLDGCMALPVHHPHVVAAGAEQLDDATPEKAAATGDYRPHVRAFTRTSLGGSAVPRPSRPARPAGSSSCAWCRRGSRGGGKTA